MFGIKSLKFTGIVTLCFFMFFVFAVETGFAQSNEEDTLSKAMRLYQEGDYEASIALLGKFIEKLKAMVEQKKNVAEAFYLLAKIYFEVGDDKKVDENLKKVFVTFPSFNKEESNFAFKERVAIVRAQMRVETEKFSQENQTETTSVQQEQQRSRVIAQPTVQKKKKFPIVLVIVGAVVVTAAIALLVLKKKSEDYDIRGDWTIRGTFSGSPFLFYMSFTGGKSSGAFVDHEGDTGLYDVSGDSVHFEYNNYNIEFNGRFSGKDSMSGSMLVDSISGSWSGSRGISTARSSLQSVATLKAQNRIK